MGAKTIDDVLVAWRAAERLMYTTADSSPEREQLTHAIQALTRAYQLLTSQPRSPDAIDEARRAVAAAEATMRETQGILIERRVAMRRKRVGGRPRSARI